MIKVNPKDQRVPPMTEIAYIPKRDIPGLNNDSLEYVIHKSRLINIIYRMFKIWDTIKILKISGKTVF